MNRRAAERLARDPEYQEVRRRQRRAIFQALKLDVLKRYGGTFCVCCGEDNIGFLTLDHIDGGGNRQRREINALGNAFYLWLKRNGYPDLRLRVLCYNCNCGRRHTGRCPHEDERVAAAS